MRSVHYIDGKETSITTRASSRTVRCVYMTPISRAVNILQSSQVPSMEPCEDFYEFACGGWTKAVVVPPDEVTTTVHSRLLRRVESEIGGDSTCITCQL